MAFDKEKFKQTLHYIISSCGVRDNVGKTVLYKLLYFSDFNFYEIYEEKMTGEDYRKIERGPAPLHFDIAVKELEQENKINHEIKSFAGYPQNRYSSIKEPNLDLLNDNEIAVISEAINQCGHMHAKAISSYSHKDMPYKATEPMDIIDYELVFYRNEHFSVRAEDED